MAVAEGIVQELLEQVKRSQIAWINGRVSEEIFAQRGDVTLMNPFGGHSGQGIGNVRPVQNRAISYFESGTDASIELLQAIVSDDVVCLVVIERSMVKFKGREAPHPWVLRVTEVFQRQGDHWRSVHRHADSLIAPRTLDEVLASIGET